MNERSAEEWLAETVAACDRIRAGLAASIEMRDRATYQHSVRVTRMACAVARELGWDTARIKELESGALLHDVGKIAVPDAVLCEDKTLSRGERALLNQHPIKGAEMLEEIRFLTLLVGVIRHHHERWDGSGYPEGLQGEEIPEAARLVAVVDAFDAMVTERPRHAAIPAAAAHQGIAGRAGTAFDPQMVEAFHRCWERGDSAIRATSPLPRDTFDRITGWTR